MLTPACLLAGFLPGGTEWLVILIIVLLLFGNRIPGLARSLGSGVNEFKAGLREGQKSPDSAKSDAAKTEKVDQKSS